MFFYKKWSPKLIFFNDFFLFFWKNTIDFWHRKLTLKVRFWQILMNHNCFKKDSFEHIDSWAKILHFRTHHLENSTIELHLKLFERKTKASISLCIWRDFELHFNGQILGFDFHSISGFWRNDRIRPHKLTVNEDEIRKSIFFSLFFSLLHVCQSVIQSHVH